MTMPRHRFVREFKPKVLRLVFNEKHPACQVADELDIPRKVLCGRLQPYRRGPLQETPTESKKEVGADKSGIARLKVALARSRQGGSSPKTRHTRLRPASSEIYAFIEGGLKAPELDGISVMRRCVVSDVSVSGFYDWRNRVREERPVGNPGRNRRFPTRSSSSGRRSAE